MPVDMFLDRPSTLPGHHGTDHSKAHEQEKEPRFREAAGFLVLEPFLLEFRV